ncbi:MAG: phenylacetate--CoA ligase family protein, partial [Ignavibacteria bacterium]|nr:phenylacetate--CoA ligase family protein [Ignavibacteria bacterium]
LRFKITIELAPGEEVNVEKSRAIGESILASILHINSEYKNYVPVEYQMPLIELRKAGDSDYFPIGVKHKYVR